MWSVPSRVTMAQDSTFGAATEFRMRSACADEEIVKNGFVCPGEIGRPRRNPLADRWLWLDKIGFIRAFFSKGPVCDAGSVQPGLRRDARGLRSRRGTGRRADPFVQQVLRRFSPRGGHAAEGIR
jgi:hypothetical protein